MKTLTLKLKENPFGRDLMPFDLKVDVKWLKAEMKRTGKPAHECISNHLTEAFERDLKRAAEINRGYLARGVT